MSNIHGDDLPLLTDVLIPGQVPAPAQSVSQGGSGDAPFDQWEDLAFEVREAVLKGLQARMELVLEQRLRETLGDMMEQVVVTMTAELKVSLRNTMREVIGRAVTAEIARLQSLRK